MTSQSDRDRFAELHQAIVALARRIEEIDIREAESHAPAVLATTLGPVVAKLLRDAEEVVTGVLRACEGVTKPDDGAVMTEPPPPYMPFERAIDAAVVQASSQSFDAIGDMAFLASLEIRQRLERLERIRAGNHWAIIFECDSALHRVGKAFMAIDRGFARAELGEARLDYASELEVALATRRTYAKLRVRVRSVGEPRGDTFYAQLRSIGTALAVVVGSRGYASLRIRDRMQLRDLQRQLIEWFQSDRDPVTGRRLWQDLDGFVDLLVDVSKRQELKEHDSRVIDDALAALEGAEGVAIETAAFLEALYGLDDEIDLLLYGRERANAGVWRSALARVKRELNHHRGAS